MLRGIILERDQATSLKRRFDQVRLLPDGLYGGGGQSANGY
jgi:hypothetical protein